MKRTQRASNRHDWAPRYVRCRCPHRQHSEGSPVRAGQGEPSKGSPRNLEGLLLSTCVDAVMGYPANRKASAYGTEGALRRTRTSGWRVVPAGESNEPKRRSAGCRSAFIALRPPASLRRFERSERGGTSDEQHQARETMEPTSS